MNPVEFIVSNKTEMRNVPINLVKHLKAKLTVPNPQYLNAVKFGRWKRTNLDKNLCFIETENVDSDCLVFPKGFTRQAINCCIQDGYPYKFVDERLKLPKIPIEFTGDLRGYQEVAVNAMLTKEMGVLEGGTGSGKTVQGINIICARKAPTLIVCHTRDLMMQWRDRLIEFTSLSADEIGLLGGGNCRIKPVTVGVVNSILKKMESEGLREKFSHVVVDECHRTPGRTFSEVVVSFPAQYVLGLSATPYRRDGLTKLIHYYCGEKLHAIDPKHLRDIGAILRPELHLRYTGFTYAYRDDYSKMITKLVESADRNQLIVNDVISSLNSSRGVILVVSDRTHHLNSLKNRFEELCPDVRAELLVGSLPAKKREEVVDGIRGGEVKIVFATLQLVGEGFDAHSLDTLIMAMPIRFSGRIIQIIGRIVRPGKGGDKIPRVIDYVDAHVGVLEKSAQARQQIYYEDIKCRVVL